MSYSCTDGFDDLMGVAQALPHYDHAAESALDDDDVNGVTELALEAFQREAQHKAALQTAARAMLAALKAAVKVADEARDEWDKAPNGMRAGKILNALSGYVPKYRADIDAIHAAIAAAKAAGIEPTP